MTAHLDWNWPYGLRAMQEVEELTSPRCVQFPRPPSRRRLIVVEKANRDVRRYVWR